MSYIELKNIEKKYDGNDKSTVLDFNLEVEENDFVVMVGPSGCGKSTTLRMIAGLEEITNGELYIDGKLMNDVDPADRGISMVFQSYALYPHMTVGENMGFALKMKKIPKEQIALKVEEAAKILGLTMYLDRKPKALSGGQRQRVALGRAIVRDAKVFLMDEPLSNLDAKLRGAMRSEILRITRDVSATTIYVSHDQIEAMTMATKIVVMNDGVVQQIGRPFEVYERPNNKFVAGFIGTPTINFFEGKIIGNVFKSDKTNDIILPEHLKLDNEVTIAIRPNEFKLEKIAMDTYQPRFLGILKHQELISHILHLHLDVNGVKIILETEKNKEYELGEEIEFTVNPSKIHIFDAKSGDRI